jgi:hypothetical protein
MNVYRWRWSIIAFCNMFIVFYTIKILYICVFITCFTSYCLCDTLMDIKMHKYVCIYTYVCICILTVFLYFTFWALGLLHILMSLWANSVFMKYVTYERMYWNITPWNLVDTYQRFGKNCCLPHHYRLQSADYSKTSIRICQSTRHHIPAHQ